MELEVLRQCSVSSYSPPAAFWKFNSYVLPARLRSFTTARMVPIADGQRTASYVGDPALKSGSKMMSLNV